MHDTDRSGPAELLRRPQEPRRSGRLPDIDARRCTGCGWCVAACDLQLLCLEAAGWVKVSVLHETDRCTGCGLCAVKCPFHAIAMRGKQPSDTPEVAGPRGRPRDDQKSKSP